MHHAAMYTSRFTQSSFISDQLGDDRLVFSVAEAGVSGDAFGESSCSHGGGDRGRYLGLKDARDYVFRARSSPRLRRPQWRRPRPVSLLP